ncbi:MAG: PTS sugar transporter subunit IIA [Candidatus Izemoplasmataceae bacterium]
MKTILNKKNILINLPSVSKEEAIKKAGQLLIDDGYTSKHYIDAMFEREKIVSTYVGNGVAIPHGVGKHKDLIYHSGIVVMQYPEGIDYDEGKAYLIIGISGKGDDHIKILSKIAESVSDLDNAEKLWHAKDVETIYKAFNGDHE